MPVICDAPFPDSPLLTSPPLETISTLRFGQRAKKIKNNAVINVQYSAEELQKQLDVMKKEMKKLVKRLAACEKELEVWRSGGTVSEAERVALSSAADAAAVSVDGEPQEEPASSGLSEQEREELLQRETELLDLLDDKVRWAERQWWECMGRLAQLAP
jgi:kinesin family protein 5